MVAFVNNQIYSHGRFVFIVATRRREWNSSCRFTRTKNLPRRCVTRLPGRIVGDSTESRCAIKTEVCLNVVARRGKKGKVLCRRSEKLLQFHQPRWNGKMLLLQEMEEDVNGALKLCCVYTVWIIGEWTLSITCKLYWNISKLFFFFIIRVLFV